MAKYLKCIQNPSNMDHEILRLRRTSPLDTGTFGPTNDYGQQNEMNNWLAGAAGISTTHYNEGQNQYYSPVGFIMEINNDHALGHFAGDGSTSLLHQGKDQYWQAFEVIRTEMTKPGPLKDLITAQNYTADFSSAVDNMDKAIVLLNRIKHFLSNGNISVERKTEVRDLIKATAQVKLKDHYQNNGFNHPLGPGNPDVLEALELKLRNLDAGTAYHHPDQNRDIKYTESQVHADLASVVGVFYTDEVGAYPNLISPTWRDGDEDCATNRKTGAETFVEKFNTAGNDDVKLYRLKDGKLEEV